MNKYVAAPYLLPVLMIAAALLAGLAAQLIASGVERRSAWRLVLGLPLALYLAAAAAVLVRSCL
jgi:hypothetical protein